MSGKRKFRFKDFAEVSRLRIQIASLSHATLGAFIGAASGGELLKVYFFIYVLLTFVLITYSCHVNSYCDVSVDLKYKKEIAQAVLNIGGENMKKMMFLDLLLAGFLMVILIIYSKLVTVALAISGTFLAWSYSSPPLRVKARGSLSFVPVMLGLYIFPVLGGWFLYQGKLNREIVLFAIFYALICQGITFVNTAEDYHEDLSEGIRTLAHVAGIRALFLTGAVMVLTGCAGISIMLFKRTFHGRGSTLTEIMALLLLFAGAYIVLRLLRAFFSSDPHAEAKKLGPLMGPWFLLTRYPIMLGALFELLGL